MHMHVMGVVRVRRFMMTEFRIVMSVIMICVVIVLSKVAVLF